MPISTITYSDKSDINVNSSVPSTNKVQATDMNEIKSVVNNNADVTNGLKGTILWTNPNPTSVFGPQNITLSSSDYDVLEVFYRSDISGGVGFSAKCLKGYGTQCVFNSNISTNMWVRRITRNSDTSFSATNCVKVNDNSTSNSQCVPLYIVGYKTELF